MHVSAYVVEDQMKSYATRLRRRSTMLFCCCSLTGRGSLPFGGGLSPKMISHRQQYRTRLPSFLTMPIRILVLQNECMSVVAKLPSVDQSTGPLSRKPNLWAVHSALTNEYIIATSFLSGARLYRDFQLTL